MRGEFFGVWSDTWREIWCILSEREDAPNDLFCELYRELNNVLKKPHPNSSSEKVSDPIDPLIEIIGDPIRSKYEFERTCANDFADERGIVTFMENVHTIFDDLGGAPLANSYFTLLETFIEKFSLRYVLRKPCRLCPTLPGVFASLIRDLRIVTSRDAHLDSLMKDFESAICDLRTDCSDTRIKTCIQKQLNLLEAVARNCPGVTATELGGICNQLDTWPHNALKASLKNLYGFASDYPGIRHGGTPASANRSIEMRDLVAMSILLVGFSPYLIDQFNADVVYRGI